MTMIVGVVGCGNVGFAFLSWLRSRGFRVLGYDIAASVKQKIANQLGCVVCANNLDELHVCDSIFICVPTESAEDGSVDISIYGAVIDELATVLKSRQDVSIIQRSTCLPGSGDYYSNILGNRISYGVNPSFLRKSTMQYDTEHPDRIAYAATGVAKKHLDVIYNGIPSSRYITDNFKSVELLKYVENTLDALLISYWNEIASYAKAINLPDKEFFYLLEHIGDRTKFCSVSRIPGKAFGLCCLPKDLLGLIIEMKRINLQPNVLDGVWLTNEHMKSKYGESNVPAQNLWTIDNNAVQILSDGKFQVSDFLSNSLT